MDAEQKIEEKVETKAAESKIWLAIKKFFINLWKNVILPCFKDMVYGMASTGANTFQSGVSKVLYNQPVPPSARQAQQNSAPFQPGRVYPTSNYPAYSYGTIAFQNYPNAYGVRQICARDRRTLEGILAKMQARISNPDSQGTVSIGEMYTYSNLPAVAEDYMAGWTSLAGCAVVMDFASNMYVLQMTEQVSL